jgi:ribosome-associated toxin RatA of RatAB toxin-antitoxin module
MIPHVLEKTFIFLVLAGILSAGLAHAEDCDAWRETGRSDAGVMFRCQGDTRIPWVMIKTQFSVRPAVLFELINNYDDFESFVPNVIESRVLERIGDRQWVLHRLQFPILFADLNYVISSTYSGSNPAEGYYRVNWQLDRRYFHGLDINSKKVPKALAGFWDIQPGDSDSTTQARYAIYNDPDGHLPTWVVTGLTERYVRQLIRAIRKHLNS